MRNGDRMGKIGCENVEKRDRGKQELRSGNCCNVKKGKIQDDITEK
jgi:hypothetical protein